MANRYRNEHPVGRLQAVIIAQFTLVKKAILSLDKTFCYTLFLIAPFLPAAGQTVDRTDYPTCQQLVYLQQQQSR